MTPCGDSSVPGPDSAGFPLDAAGLWDRVGGERDLLAELVQIFHAESTPMLQRLEDAIDTADARRVQETAHKLCGSLMVLGAGPALQAARALESLGQRGTVTGAGDLLTALADHVDQVTRALERLLQAGEP